MNYTKEDLEGKVRKELVEIAKDLNLTTSGNRTDLINRIFDHKPSFEDMISSAPVSKDGDINISIEEKPNLPDDEVDIGVEVNDAYPDEEPEGATTEELSHAEPEAEDKEPEAEDKIEKATVITAPPIEVAETAKTPEGMVPENTAQDILKGWRNTIQAFYTRNVSGIAPSRPSSAEFVAEQLGRTIAIPILKNWQATIIAQLRPTRGLAPGPPKSVKDVIQIIKSL
jgi:hypothetical protein